MELLPHGKGRDALDRAIQPATAEFVGVGSSHTVGVVTEL
jgi:hypothetical protein